MAPELSVSAIVATSSGVMPGPARERACPRAFRDREDGALIGAPDFKGQARAELGARQGQAEPVDQEKGLPVEEGEGIFRGFSPQADTLGSPVAMPVAPGFLFCQHPITPPRWSKSAVPKAWM